MSNDVSLDINQKSNPVQAVAPPKEDNNMLRATDKITALYCRLSVEDTKEKDYGKEDRKQTANDSDMFQFHFFFCPFFVTRLRVFSMVCWFFWTVCVC